MTLATVITRELCLQKIAFWQSQLDAATRQPPKHGREDLRERVVRDCSKYLNRWNRRLVQFERLHGAPPPRAA